MVSPTRLIRITAPAAIKSKLNAAEPSSLPPVVGSVLGVPIGVASGETAGATAVAISVGVSVVLVLTVGTGVPPGAVVASGVTVPCWTG